MCEREKVAREKVVSNREGELGREREREGGNILCIISLSLSPHSSLLFFSSPLSPVSFNSMYKMKGAEKTERYQLSLFLSLSLSFFLSLSFSLSLSLSLSLPHSPFLFLSLSLTLPSSPTPTLYLPLSTSLSLPFM